MHVLRASFYGNPLVAGPEKQDITHGIMRSIDLADSLTIFVARTEMKYFPEDDKKVSRGFVATDVFHLSGEPSLEACIAKAMKRWEKRRDAEINQSILYYYNVQTLSQVRPGGVLSATQKSPLTRDQILDVFEQITHHPVYAQQTMVSITKADEVVTYPVPGEGEL
jgi:hypothetical protein